jgi:sucrose phosphorylase
LNLTTVYGRSEAIQERRKKYQEKVVLNEQDSIPNTYADTVSKEREIPLRTLHRFLEKYVREAVTIVHVLPFFPSSSDAGYAVVDFKRVDPRFGHWEDVRKLAKKYRLMVDLVMNHVSSQSEWFQGFLRGDKRYRDYFIWRDTCTEMPRVFRPRESPLFTEVETRMGKKFVWTTFSEDQADLNYRSPEVLPRMIDVLLFYLSQGVEIITKRT